MFPKVELNRIEELVMINGLEECVDLLLEETSALGVDSGVEMQASTPSSLQSVLSTHSRQIMNTSNELFLKLNKEDLWPRALTFYKDIKNDLSKLRQDINIEFEQEEGSDAGAIKITFFEMLLRAINLELFEGREEKRVPKKDWGLDGVMEIAGIMVGHSILCGGPSFNCLLPAHYFMLRTGITNSDLLPSEYLPTVQDIPESPGYCDLLDLIHKVDKCNRHNYFSIFKLMKMVMFSSFNFSLNLSSNVSDRCFHEDG